MTESRLQRWSRKKAEHSHKTEASPALPVENEPSAEEQELAINQTLPEHEVLFQRNGVLLVKVPE